MIAKSKKTDLILQVTELKKGSMYFSGIVINSEKFKEGYFFDNWLYVDFTFETEFQTEKEKERENVIREIKTSPKHYDNSKGSLYKFAEDKNLNAYEFDIIKRVIRCRKKGLFREDLEKTKFLIDLYLKEYDDK